MFTGAERIVLCKNSSERNQAVSNSNSKAELKRVGGIRPMGWTLFLLASVGMWVYFQLSSMRHFIKCSIQSGTFHLSHKYNHASFMLQFLKKVVRIHWNRREHKAYFWRTFKI